MVPSLRIILIHLLIMTIVALVSSNTAPTIGLVNLGNTCYLNSQLQCAYSIPKVRDLLTDSQQPPTILGELFAEMMRHGQQSGSKTQAVSPRSFCQALGIPVHEQQDSHEFWKLLLPTLPLPDLIDLYKGELENYIKAVDGRERRRKEPFLDLSLDIGSASNVEDAIVQSYLTPETLSAADGNGWRPVKGEEPIDAQKGAVFTQHLPSVLQLHLKRFQYDWQSETMSKLNKRLPFPLQFKFPANLSSSDCEYVLQAVVVHAGEYGSGHYYAYVRPDPQSEQWFRCNDARIETVTWEDVSRDAFGGKQEPLDDSPVKKSTNPLCRLLRRLRWNLRFSADPYGFGGQTSNAYVLQYVRRCKIDMLFGPS